MTSIYTPTIFRRFSPIARRSIHIPHCSRRRAREALCDVVIYHPDHNMLPSQMPVVHWRLVVDLWTRRFRELAAWADIQYVFIFENTGAAIGVTMPHPHGQTYALP